MSTTTTKTPAKANDGHKSRQKLRRDFAVICMWQIAIIVFAFLWGLASDPIASRVEKVWPPFAVIFPALISYLLWYIKMGSDETKHETSIESERHEREEKRRYHRDYRGDRDRDDRGYGDDEDQEPRR